jgi:hypothetical protein
MATDSAPTENSAAPHCAAAEKTLTHSNQTKISFRSIRPASGAASPRHKALCNPRKRSSAQKSSIRDPPCPTPVRDNRTCCIRTNTFGPWLID